MKSIMSIIHFKYKSGNIPILYDLEENKIPLLPLFYVFYLKDHKDLSYQKIYKVIRSIGLLYDYHKIHLKNKELNEYETKTLISGFIKERTRSEILGWKKVQKETVQHDFYNLRDFSIWCKNNYEILDFGYQENSFKGVMKEAFKEHIGKNTKLLYHLNANKKQLPNMIFSMNSSKVPKAFPYDRIKELIDKTPSARDKIILLLLAFGGKRISELSHIFVQDIIPNNKKIKVRIAHPQYSYFEWISNNKVKKGMREEYLKEAFNLYPRNTLDKGEMFSGWKGMAFDDESLKMSEVYFICNVEKYLYKLHLEYFHSIRKNFNHHPYYFINNKGEPLTVGGIKKVFYRACKRIGINEFSTNTGLTPHALRHFYGFYCIDILGLDILLIQKYMGHSSIMSTQTYANISKKKANEMIKKANINNKIDFTKEGEDV